MYFTDQTGNTISLSSPAARIVSVVPSQTELLHYLGLDNEVTGITKFCIHPDEWFRTKNRVGGTKNLKIDLIRKLNPDLILANKEENQKGQLEALKMEFPVWISDIKNLDDALRMISDVGELTGKSQEAGKLNKLIAEKFNRNVQTVSKAAYIIWNEPLMAAGADTFIHDMMLHAGFANVMANRSRYPEITDEELQQLNPQYILLSSEPFPFNESHVKSFRERFPRSTVLLVDGELFSWYGSRLLSAPAYFDSLPIHS